MGSAPERNSPPTPKGGLAQGFKKSPRHVRVQRETWLLGLILLWAAALRFWRFWDIDFTHDELSAMLRLQFSSFGELLQKGIYVDNHPAGLQIFLYYYTRLFGESEAIVKLPFILMGLAAVYLIYRIGKLWGNSTAGLLAASAMACSQYFVMYSQIARPYIAGCFFVLLAVLYWWKYLHSESKWGHHYWLWVIFAAACAYIHHFSLLAVALTGVSGVLFLKKEKLWPYLLSGLAIFVLYIPHLPIFLTQLNRGGLDDWLGAPSLGFFGELMAWALHFSPLFAATVVLALAVGWLRPGKAPRYPIFVTAFGWFLLTAAIGYFYSREVAPILQFSLLIFTFPFVLLFIFSGVSFSKNWILPTLVVLILGSGTWSLAKGRDYYHIFYVSAYGKTIEAIKEKQLNNPDAIVWAGGREDIISHYLAQFEVDTSRLTMVFEISQFPELITDLQNTDSENILLATTANSPPEMIAVARQFFPFLKERQSYRNGEFYWLSKSPPPTEELVDTVIQLGPAEIFDSTEYVLVHDMHLPLPMGIDPRGFLDLTCLVRADSTLNGVMMAMAVHSDDSIVHWRSADIGLYQSGAADQEWISFQSVQLHLVDWANAGFLRCFIWNRGGEKFKVEEFKLTFREGNPRLYGHFLPLAK